MNKKILIILLLAFLVRLIAIDQSLWLDEAVTVNVVSNFSYGGIINKFSPTDFHPPFFYLVEKFWTNIFGYSEIVLRFPSIIFSILTGWILYKIAGNWAAALFLFNPLIIYYSQETRPYLMVTFFLITAFYFLNRSIPKFFDSSGSLQHKSAGHPKSQKIWYFHDFFLANLFIFLSLLTFYGSVFFIFAIYICLLIKREFKLLFLLLPGFILAVLLIFPLITAQYLNSKIALNDVKNWSLVLGQANLKNLLLIPIKFSIGRISFDQKILYYSIAGLWSMFVFYFVIKGWKSMLFVITLLTILLAFIASFITPLLQYFRFIYLIPLMSLLLAIYAKNNLTKSVLISGFVIFSFIYLLNPTYHREDWKSLVSDIKTKTIYMIPSSSDAVKYYNKKIEIKDLKAIDQMDLENEITIIPYTSEIHGVTYAVTLGKLGYRLGKEKSYRELKTEYWILEN